MAWRELVVFSNPRHVSVRPMFCMDTEQCKSVQELLRLMSDYPEPEVPMPDEFTEVYSSQVIEGIYDEVSPFPDMNRARMAGRILRGGKIYQWGRLDPPKRFKNYRPFDAYRGNDGVFVSFIDPKEPLEKKPVPNCRRDCLTGGMNQCAAFGSYSQIELNNARILPLWPDRCSAESAQTCPMRKAAISGAWPNPSTDDPIVKEFQEWLKTRNKKGK